MSKDQSRREFLGRMAGTTAFGAGMTVFGGMETFAPAANQTLPKRTLAEPGRRFPYWRLDAGAGSLCTRTRTKRYRS